MGIRSIKLLVSLAAASFAAPSASTAQHTGESPLAWLVGSWSGEAWVEMQPGRRDMVAESETVRLALDDQLVFIEGVGRAMTEGSDAGQIVHQAVAVISPKPGSGGYRIHAWRLHQGRPQAVEGWIEIEEHGFDWGFEPAPGMAVRYEVRRTELGEWHETGWMSFEGSDWRVFFEMKLRRARS